MDPEKLKVLDWQIEIVMALVESQQVRVSGMRKGPDAAEAEKKLRQYETSLISMRLQRDCAALDDPPQPPQTVVLQEPRGRSSLISAATAWFRRLLTDRNVSENDKTATPGPTLAVLAERYMAIHGPALKPHTQEHYQRRIRLDLIPEFGATPVSEITRDMVTAAHAKWSANPIAANYSLAVLSSLMTWAADQGYRPEDSNPCRSVQRYKEARRGKVLTPTELAKLIATLDQAETQHLIGSHAAAAIRLLLLTGARLNEILALEWSQVDLERQLIVLPAGRPGGKSIALNDASLALLRSLPRLPNNPYVFVGSKPGTHIVNIQRSWRTVRDLAELAHLQLQDLRHAHLNDDAVRNLIQHRQSPLLIDCPTTADSPIGIDCGDVIVTLEADPSAPIEPDTACAWKNDCARSANANQHFVVAS